MAVKLRENTPNQSLPFPKIMVDAYREGIILFLHNKEQATVLKHYRHDVGDYVGTATFTYRDLEDYDGIIPESWIQAINPDFVIEEIPHFNWYNSDIERQKQRHRVMTREYGMDGTITYKIEDGAVRHGN